MQLVFCKVESETEFWQKLFKEISKDFHEKEYKDLKKDITEILKKECCDINNKDSCFEKIVKNLRGLCCHFTLEIDCCSINKEYDYSICSGSKYSDIHEILQGKFKCDKTFDCKKRFYNICENSNCRNCYGVYIIRCKTNNNRVLYIGRSGNKEGQKQDVCRRIFNTKYNKETRRSDKPALDWFKDDICKKNCNNASNTKVEIEVFCVTSNLEGKECIPSLLEWTLLESYKYSNSNNQYPPLNSKNNGKKCPDKKANKSNSKSKK